MKKESIIITALIAMAILSAACSFQEPSLKTDLLYPAQTVKLEIVNTAGMSTEEEEGFRTALITALLERNIRVHNPSDQTLKVEVVTYHQESQFKKTMRKAAMLLPLGGFVTFSTSNALDLRASLQKADSVARFPKFEEIKESADNFEQLTHSMTRRVAGEVLGENESP